MGYLRTNLSSTPVITGPPLSANIVAQFSADSMALANNATVSSWTDSKNGIVAGTVNGTAPTFQTNRVNGKPSVKFVGTGGLNIATPGVLKTAIDSQNYTVLIAFRSAASNPNGFGMMFSATAGGASFGYNADSSIVQHFGPDSGVPYPGQTSFSTFGSTASTAYGGISQGGALQSIYINGGAYTTKNDQPQGTGGNTIAIGSNFANTIFGYCGEIFDILVWNVPLTPAQYMQAEMWARDKYAQAYPWASLSVFNTFYGDSITQGVQGSGTRVGPAQQPAYVAAQTLGLTFGQWHNLAIGGANSVQLDTAAPWLVDPIPAAIGKVQNLIGFEWYNEDLVYGNPTLSITHANTYLAARKAVANQRTVWGTSTSIAADPNANRAVYNAGTFTNVDSFMPIHTNSQIGVNGSYVTTVGTVASGSDGVHLNPTGYAALASIFVAGIQALGGSGKAQVNMWTPYSETDLSTDFPFIDHTLQNVRFWQQSGAVAGTDIYPSLNAYGYPKNMPSTAYQWNLTVGSYLPDAAASNPDAKIYVFLTDATMNIQIGSSDATMTRTLGSNTSLRQEFTMTSGSIATAYGDPVRVGLQINAITADTCTYMKWFLKSNETDLITNGKLLAPHFKAEYSRFGRVRYMDWQKTNGNPQVDWSNRVTTQRSKIGINVVNYMGIATLAGTDYTCPGTPTGNPSAYTDGLQISFTTASTITYKTITNFENRNPARVTTSVAHGYSNGDQVTFPNGSLSVDGFTSGRIFTIGNVTSTTFELTGYDSTTWPAYGGGDHIVSKVVRVKAGALPFAPIWGVDSNTLSAAQTSQWDDDALRVVNLIYSTSMGGWVVSLILDGGTDGNIVGIPIEMVVQTANELNVSPHICIPHLANDNFVTQTATYVKNNLSSSLVCTFELSNEVWNSAFIQTHYAYKMARNNGWSTGASADYWLGWRFYTVMGLIGTVFSGQMNRINRAMGCFTGAIGAGGNDVRFQGTGTGVAGFPISRADSIHIAPYYEGDRNFVLDAQSIWEYNYGNPTQKQNAINWLDGFLTTNTSMYTVKTCHDTYFPAWKAIAAAPAPGITNLSLEQYEGGGGQLGIGGNTGQIWNRTTGTYTNVYNTVPLTNTDCQNFIFGYLQSPEWAATLRLQWDNFCDPTIGKGKLPSQYTLCSAWALGGQWGVIKGNLINGVRTNAYNALVSFNG